MPGEDNFGAIFLDPEAFASDMANRPLAFDRSIALSTAMRQVQQSPFGDDLEAIVVKEDDIALKLHELIVTVIETVRCR